MTSLPRITPLAVGASALVAALCRELRVAEIVNRMVRWDSSRWRVSPGTLVCALIVNILVVRKPLYKVQPFYERLDLNGLFNEPTVPDCFNDDALARMLSCVARVDKKSLVESIACEAVCYDHIPIRSIHADTTSVSLYGEFEPTESDQEFQRAQSEQPLLSITHGYSKQKRGDLKQFLVGLVVTSDGMPVTADIRDGNFSDKTWNKETLEGLKRWSPQDLAKIQRDFLDPEQLVYVADSALVTAKNLNAIDDAKIRFISRLPERYSLADELKTAAFAQDDWTDHGKLAQNRKAASYVSTSMTRTLHQRSYRFVVVRSSSLDRRKWETIQKRMVREETTLAKATNKLSKRTFSCEQDAATELAQFIKEHPGTYHSIRGDLISFEEIRRRPGRPRKGEMPPTLTQYRLAIHVDPPDEQTLTILRAKASMFILITNLHDETEWSDGAILREYKGQTHVEGRFRWLKHPLLVDGIFVKSQHRAEALAYIFLIALILGSYLEQRIRRELERTKQTVEIEGARFTSRPTIQAILEVVNYLDVLRVEIGNEVHRVFPHNTPERRFELIRLAGYDPSIIYLRGG